MNNLKTVVDVVEFCLPSLYYPWEKLTGRLCYCHSVPWRKTRCRQFGVGFATSEVVGAFISVLSLEMSSRERSG